jgi:hypothetical protein
VEPLELDVLATEDAARFLLERTERARRRTQTDEADAGELARELGGLALALEQAGAYIVQRRLSLADYLAKWRGHVPGVVEWHDERIMKYPRSVAVTWQTTIDQLGAGEGRPPVAAGVDGPRTAAALRPGGGRCGSAVAGGRGPRVRRERDVRRALQSPHCTFELLHGSLGR